FVLGRNPDTDLVWSVKPFIRNTDIIAERSVHTAPDHLPHNVRFRFVMNTDVVLKIFIRQCGYTFVIENLLINHSPTRYRVRVGLWIVIAVYPEHYALDLFEPIDLYFDCGKFREQCYRLGDRNYFYGERRGRIQRNAEICAFAPA